MKRNILARMMKDESGATAIEYGLIVALVSMAAITALHGFGRFPRFTHSSTTIGGESDGRASG